MSLSPLHCTRLAAQEGEQSRPWAPQHHSGSESLMGPHSLFVHCSHLPFALDTWVVQVEREEKRKWFCSSNTRSAVAAPLSVLQVEHNYYYS